MAVLDFTPEVWTDALGSGLPAVPDALILEGTWWQQEARARRMAELEEVEELPFPEMYVGRRGPALIAYCCAYGAARAVEPAHVFAQLGTPLIVQIGTCGVMDAAIPVGAVAVPRAAKAWDGLSPHYGAGDEVAFDARRARRAEALLRGMGVETRETRHLTWPSLFVQSDACCAEWGARGLQTVDMEAAAVAAVAARFGRACVTLLGCWDALSEGRTFLDPLPPEGAERLGRANEATYAAALALAGEEAGRRAA